MREALANSGYQQQVEDTESINPGYQASGSGLVRTILAIVGEGQLYFFKGYHSNNDGQENEGEDQENPIE
jgi:hypothetical protein